MSLANLRPYLVAAAALTVVSGCMQRGDIVRVQPNVTRKSDLIGTPENPKIWYFRNTVTWTPANTGFTFEGETGSMEKLVFEIQENNLVGYRAYPLILGTDPNIDPTSRVSGTTARYCDKNGQCLGGQPYFGAPIVSFPISSHFDIQRQYNPATGEQTNVIVENSSDRIWNQREYIRVDWSVNNLNKFAGLSYGAVSNPLGGSSNASWIQPNEKVDDPQDLPQFEADDKGELKYFDFTGRYVANPTLYYFEDYGYYPACWFSLVYDCSSAEIRMRISFSRVDKQKSRNYESLVYPTDLQTKFAYYGVDRLNWDKKYGIVESAIVHIAGRYRIWEEAYEKDDNGDPILSKPIKLADRKAKPIVYYLTPAYRMGGQENYDLYRAPAAKLEKNWDKAFRRAAAAAQGKLTPAEVDAYQQMLFVCDNPVPDYTQVPGIDAATAEARQAACGKPGFSPKFGDLRYAFMNTIAEPVPNGLLGYGPNSTDPETGEIISANANTYTWGIESEAQYMLDLIDLITGEKSPTDYIKGDVVKNYILDNPIYSVKRLPDGNSSQSPLLSAGGVTRTDSQSLGAFEKPTQKSLQLIQQLKANGGLPTASGDPLRAAADQLAEHPELESAILDNPDFTADIESLLPPSLSDRAGLDPDFRRKMARTLLTNVRTMGNFERTRLEQLTSKDCHYLAEFNDRTMLSLAFREKAARDTRIAELVGTGLSPEDAKKKANEEIKGRLKQNVWEATSEHEIGHTFNLVHNFQGSYDAINYMDSYWDIRKPTLTVKDPGTMETLVPRTVKDLRAAADGTQLQHAQGLYDYEYSSIMDYAGTRTGDWQGVGKYDEAAILFAYSGDANPGYVEAFDKLRGDKKSFRGSDGAMVDVTGGAYDVPIVNANHYTVNYRNYTEQYHYSMVPLHFGEGNTIDEVITDGIAKMKKRHLVKWTEAEAARTRLRDLITSKNGLPLTEAEVTGTMPVLEVPYMNCSDPHKNRVLSCNWFDRGPDYYEITRTKLENYWNYYIVTHFRRGRAAFSGYSAVTQAWSLFSDVSDIYKQWVLFMYGKAANNQQVLANYAFDPLFEDYWTMAVLDGINQHMNVMNVPPAGYFMFRNFTTPIPDGQGNPLTCTTDEGCPFGLCSNGQCRIGPRWDLISEGDDFDALNMDGKTTLKNYYSDTGFFNPAASGFGELPRGLGRRMYSRYDFKSGYGFWYRMLEAGHYFDQVGAMFAAIDYQTLLYDVDYQSDANRYRIPYYTVFKSELTKTFGALWAANEDLVRPFAYLKLDEAGTVIPETMGLQQRRFVAGEDYVQGFQYPYDAKDRVIQCTATRTTDCFKTGNINDQKAAPINISVTWTSRIYSLYLGEAAFKVNFDLDYAKANQVYKLGGGEQITVAPGFHSVEVEDILTGSRYAAVEKDGTVYPYSTPALRVVRETGDYLAMVRDPAQCPLPGTLRIYGCMSAADRNNPIQLEIARKNWTESYKYNLRDLDLMRGFYGVFGKAF